LEFEGIWLEVRKSYATIRQVRSIDSKVLEVPAILEVLEIAASIKQGQGVLWQYARRLRLDESDHIKKVVNFVEKVEDDRSISLLADMKYKGTCYTLTLFAIKR
jgi:hypothetical protein